MKKTGQISECLDTKLYPFENRYIQLSSGKMHYIDEGEGALLLFIHGTPTWSFLYRDFISALSKNYRCIAVDHIGFGLSEKPEHFDGKPQSHAENLSIFMEELDLKDVTLVVHDFGGPIGLGAAIHNSDRIRQIVLFNSWLWETKSNPSVQKVDRLINSRIGKFLYLRMNFSPRVLIKQGVYDKKKLTKKVHQQYINPFPSKKSRQSLLKIAKSLSASSKWYQEQWENLHFLESKPWLILWGKKDAFITLEDLEKWKKRLPNAKVSTYDCGHFLQEEKAPELISEIDDFMKASSINSLIL